MFYNRPLCCTNLELQIEKASDFGVFFLSLESAHGRVYKGVNLTTYRALPKVMCMKTMTTAELKAEFSSVVSELKQGHEVAITYGRKKEPLATIVPQSKITKPDYSIELGNLRKK